jgi:hypothetical protein
VFVLPERVKESMAARVTAAEVVVAVVDTTELKTATPKAPR